MTLAEHYQRNADAAGHTPDCRCRVIPAIGNDHRALDVERCERCRYLLAKLDAAREARQAARDLHDAMTGGTSD